MDRGVDRDVGIDGQAHAACLRRPRGPGRRGELKPGTTCSAFGCRALLNRLASMSRTPVREAIASATVAIGTIELFRCGELHRVAMTHLNQAPGGC